ncbi:2-hydroxyacid dehydrogenase [Yinghuangia seranimata]|uniref:2-hydroxyacid dehydrogenase n=1 Tax=Yinghuangia seranimata TaxID=408067 RepID=UPI00248D33CD|nr:2-hydroxyacid dehydrogenase [Yinghuangia seranimata]MDI2129350.1 2-hydroxyacid dehydrogenase [Yinghuangia seranimata]
MAIPTPPAGAGPDRLLIPYEPAALGDLPPGLDIEVYDGFSAPPTRHDDVAFYVLPYTFDPAPLRLLRDMPQVRFVQTLTAGYEHVLPYLPPGAVLANGRGIHETSTAELAVALTLASLRGIPSFVRGQDAGEWRDGFYPALADKTVVIVGYGAIGEAVERRLAGFEVDLVRVARSARTTADGLPVHAISELPALLPAADVVIVCTPLTDETRGLVDAEFLARMHDGALLVNVARGLVVDTKALLAEVSTGRITAAVDVTDPEPLPADHPLRFAPGVLISPHVGGSSSAFLPRAMRLVRNQVTAWATGAPLANIVHGG